MTGQLEFDHKTGGLKIPPRLDGPCYNPVIDGARLGKQFLAIWNAMMDGDWWSLSELREATGYPESSISAQMRHFRKERFGSHDVEKRRRGETSGTWEYRLCPNLKGGRS